MGAMGERLWMGERGWRKGAGIVLAGCCVAARGTSVRGSVRSAYRFGYPSGDSEQQCRFPSCQDVGLSLESLFHCLLWGSRGRSPLAEDLGLQRWPHEVEHEARGVQVPTRQSRSRIVIPANSAGHGTGQSPPER